MLCLLNFNYILILYSFCDINFKDDHVANFHKICFVFSIESYFFDYQLPVPEMYRKLIKIGQINIRVMYVKYFLYLYVYLLNICIYLINIFMYILYFYLYFNLKCSIKLYFMFFAYFWLYFIHTKVCLIIYILYKCYG